MAVRNRQDSIIKTDMKQITKKVPQKKHHLEAVSKKSLEGLNIFNGTNLTLNFDVDQDLDVW